MIDRADLDKNVEEKKKVQVKIILPNPQIYRKYANTLKQTAKESSGIMSVKMI